MTSVEVEFSDGSVMIAEATDSSQIFDTHVFVATVEAPGEPGTTEITAIRTASG